MYVGVAVWSANEQWPFQAGTEAMMCFLQTPYGSDVPSRRQQQRQYMTNGTGAYPNGAPGSGGYPSHYAGSQRAAQGVAYDERTGQFIVNGQPYGAYR